MSPAGRAGEALALFDQWLELEPLERQRRLDALAVRDAALHAKVAALFAADVGTGLLERPAAMRLRAAAVEEDENENDAILDRRIGPWRITGILGRGGMGAVYRGERVEGGFQQLAALKLIRLGMDQPELRSRFVRERQILARLRHPNIATLLDGGVTDEGAPYFAMELVQGERITRWCDARQLAVRERIRLFLQVLDAVAFAHGQLIVHRDLKPSNILVDGSGHVYLLDFGIAKLLEEGDAGLTGTMGRAFTPEYASPEQLGGEPISTATDLHQLGVLLYALLGQAHPYGLTGDTPLRARLARMDDDPRPLWEAARETTMEHAARCGSTPVALARQLRGDLSAIASRCLARDAGQRYGSVDALRDDLRAWLDGRPVAAREPTLGYRAGRFLRRNKLAVSATAVVVVALAAGLGVSLWQAGIARREAQRALEQQRIAARQAELARMQADSSLAVQELLTGMFARSLAMDGGHGTTVHDLIEATRATGARGDALDAPARTQLLLRMGRISAVAGDEAGARSMLGQARALLDSTGAVRPRLLAQHLDVQLSLAESLRDLPTMMRLAPPLLRLLEGLPQPLDEEMLQLRLRTLRSQGWALDQSGRSEESIAVRREEWRAILQRYGHAHRRSLVSRASYGRVLALSGRFAEGTTQLKAALDGMGAADGPMSLDRLHTTLHLAEAMRQTGTGSVEALRLLRSAEAQARQQRDRLQPFYLSWIQALQADILREQGDLAAAAELLAQAARFHPDAANRTSRAVGAVILTAQSDLAWARQDAQEATRLAGEALVLSGTPVQGDNGDLRRALGLRLRVLRGRASSLPVAALRTEIDALLREWDAVPTVLRSDYLAMAAEALRVGGTPDAALARRALAAAEAEPEPQPRRQALAREEWRRALRSTPRPG
ncbi:serine/threonine protein kinase [Pseudomonas sp. R2.Fl]|nr:serine/threonine protein kinase [Pseudomonas sp. R2.Fl]